MYIANKNKIYRRYNNMVSSCQYHAVWCSKYRRKVLTTTIKERLQEIILGSQKDFSFQVIEMDISLDRVHLLIDCDAKMSIYSIVSKIKGRSSKLLREEYPELKKRLPCLWNNSKFISTCGDVALLSIQQYVEEQKKQ